MKQQSTNNAPTQKRGALLATAFMLFSMFFGAGNLIFPPMLGVFAGQNFTPAIIGFLIAGVVLPVLSTVAVAVSGADVSDLSRRVGAVFGVIFPVLVYLAIGPLYAMPRMGSVSYTTAFVPITGIDSLPASILFNLAFFGLSLVLAWNSSRILDSVGRILTPALLLFLSVLIIRAFTTLTPGTHAATSEFAERPIISGMLQGYLTMDSIAALAFGIIVIRALRTTGAATERTIVAQTTLAASIAAILLALVYVGLGFIGHAIPHPETYENGAVLLSDAASLTMGVFGRWIFGFTVLAACLTTSVGLLSACSGFFHRLFPQVGYHVWLIIFTLITAVLSIQGLGVLLQIAGPLIGFLYPIGITLVLLTLIAPLFAGRSDLVCTFRWATVTAVLWSAATTLVSLDILPSLFGAQGAQIHTLLDSALALSPWQAHQLGWLLPVAIVALLAWGWDMARGTRRGA